MGSTLRHNKKNRAGRPSRAELERRKKRVLDIATQLFLKQGYADTHLSDIGAKAGVALRTVYQHFGDKAAVFKAIVDTRIKGQEVKLAGITEDQSLYEALLKVARYAHGMSFEQRAVPVTRLMVAESARFPRLIRALTRHIKARFRHNIISAFKSLAARGDIPDRDHEESAGFFIDLIVGTGPTRVIMDPSSEIPSESELVAKVKLFILGRYGPEVADAAGIPGVPDSARRTSMSSDKSRASKVSRMVL